MNHRKALTAMMLSGVLFITGCGNNQEAHTESTGSAPATSSEPKTTPKAPDAPSLKKEPPVKLKADKDVARELEKAGKKAQDAWYLETVRSSGAEDSNKGLLATRKKVCSDLKADPNISPVSDALAKEGFTEKQQGVIIAASMVSGCPDVSVSVKKKDVPNKAQANGNLTKEHSSSTKNKDK